MRFHTTETVQTPDTEQVLHALEVSLREISDEVERSGYQITLRGLGPSPRARNYRDTTVFEVASNNGTTTINADVMFQASALLAPSGQDSVVREKLDYAFGQMRAQLRLPAEAGREIRLEIVEPAMRSLSAIRLEHEEDFSRFSSYRAAGDGAGQMGIFAEEAVEEVSAESIPVPEEFSDVREEIPLVESTADETLIGPPPVLRNEPEVGSAEDLVESKAEERVEPASAEPAAQAVKEETTEVAEPVEQPAAAVLSEAVPAAHRSSSRARVASFASDSGARRRAQINQQINQLRSGAHTLRLASGEAAKTQFPVLIVGILAVLVAAGSVFLYWSGDLNLEFARKMISLAPAPQPVAPSPVTVTPVPDAPPRHEEADPKVWLNQWADAMRGRDPDLQASFYANPVVNYLGDPNVSNERLTTAFRSAIQARDGIWSLKPEKISVSPRSPDDLKVTMTKHFMQIVDSTEESAHIADRFVRSRLELRRINGEWKIVSEQDQTAPPAVTQ